MVGSSLMEPPRRIRPCYAAWVCVLRYMHAAVFFCLICLSSLAKWSGRMNSPISSLFLGGGRRFHCDLKNTVASAAAYGVFLLVNIACKKESMGIIKDGKDVYFWDDWPSIEEFGEHAVLPHLDENTTLFCVYDGGGHMYLRMDFIGTQGIA